MFRRRLFSQCGLRTGAVAASASARYLSFIQPQSTPTVATSTPAYQPASTFRTDKRLYSSSMLRLARGAGKPGNTGSESSWSVQPNYTPSTGESSSSSQSTADSLTPQVRAHLVRVYNLLAAGVVMAGATSALMIMTPLWKVIPWWFPMFGGMIPLFWLMLRPPATVQGRLALYFAFTALEGMALAPLVKMTAIKGVLGTSLVMTGAVFCGFSAAAYLSPRASMLALQGPLFGMLIGMVAVSLLNLIYPTAFAHSLILYGGLALFSMFVAVDTQAMIERARCGAGDHVQDALQMFLNVVNIFVRIAQILGSMNNN